MPKGLNTKKLDQILAALIKGTKMRVRVGILGDKNTRTAGGEGSNAEIGAKHEFGADGMPQRSFLRQPITDEMQKFLDKSDAFDKELLSQVVQNGSLEPWLKKIGIVGEAIVAEGFASSGFGKWAPWRPGYENNTGDILVDTQQLRNSITSDVK